MRPVILHSGRWMAVLGALSAATVMAVTPIAAEQPDQARARARTVPATTATQDPVRKYSVTASEGSIVPGHLRVKLGERIRITFVSLDDAYGLRMKDFGIKEKLTPERPVVVELIPQSTGTFEFRCTRWGVKRFASNGAVVVSQ